MKDYKYSYYVVFSYRKGNREGTGSITIYQNNKIIDCENIANIREFIANERELTNVLILFWTPFEKE